MYCNFFFRCWLTALALITYWDATNRSNQTAQKAASLVTKPVVVPISLFLMGSRDNGDEAAAHEVSVCTVSPH